MASGGTVLLLGGPAGAGKSTLARAWCGGRLRSAHVELDAVRGLIVSGLADPQEPGELAERQYELAVEAVCALARAFAAGGYDVAVDDVLEPAAFERHWRPRLAGLRWEVVVVLPALAETLERSRARAKLVREEHTRAQHRRCAAWPSRYLLDTSGLDVPASLRALEARLGVR